MSQETMLTPLALRFFKFGELENSGMFAIGGVVVLLASIVVFALSRRRRAAAASDAVASEANVSSDAAVNASTSTAAVEDRTLVIAGLFLMGASCVWALFTLPMGEATSEYHYPFLMLHFAGSATIFISGFCVVSLAVLSLFGKILREETQGDEGQAGFQLLSVESKSLEITCQA